MPAVAQNYYPDTIDYPYSKYFYHFDRDKWLDGDTFVDEDDDVFCLWRADFDDELGALVYGMDLFSREGGLWRRSREEHVEYAHSPAFLSGLLEKHGFTDLKLEEEDDRLHVQCRRSVR